MMDAASFAHICRNDFRSFARKAFEIINPATPFLDNWHIGAVVHALEEMRLGAYRRVIINIPPRMLKSQLTSVYWPAFLLGHDPATKIIVVSYSEQLAEMLSNDARRLMQSNFYQAVFPRTRLQRQSNLHLSTDQNGFRIGATVGGSVTGFGADWIMVDDPHNASEAYSEAAREKVKIFHGQTLISRFNNPAEGRHLLVMQRLHEDDLSGHLLKHSGWRHLKLQARATEDAEIAIGPGLVRQVRAGELLQPDLLPAHWLDGQKLDMGSAAFEAQYQQQPLPAEGNMIKREWLRYCDPPPRDTGRVTLCLDTATKENTENDYSACTVWLEVDQKHHLIHVWRDKVNFPALRRKTLDMIDVFRPKGILIEDAGSGSALIQDLHGQGVPAIARKAKDSKVVRLSSASPYIESGLMWLPKDEPWLAEFEAELLGFPGTRYDDQVDSLSQYFNWVRERPASLFEVHWMHDELGTVDHDSIASKWARW
jgi:predicted phage terminase large subunit-like protein